MDEDMKRTEDSGFDAIERPSHYCEGRKYEPDLVAQDWGFAYNAYKYNALKYLSRAGRKEYKGMTPKQSEIKDLQKAVWELNRLISVLEREE